MEANFKNTATKPTVEDPHGEKFSNPLAATLKILIKQVVIKLKEKSKEFLKDQAIDHNVDRATNVSSSMLEDHDNNSSTMSKKKRYKSIVLAEIETSFEIREGYDLDDHELDKLPVPHQLNPITSGVKCDTGLKFLERLSGWKLQCRQRSSGALDTYFHHVKANKTFRSSKEVINFILCEMGSSRSKKPTEAPNENFSGLKENEEVPKNSSTSSNSYSYREKSKKKPATAGINEVEKKAVDEVPISFNVDCFHLESAQVPKRKRTNSRKAKKYVALSSNVEVQNKKVSVLELPADNLCDSHEGYMPKPSYSSYEYEVAKCLIELKYGVLGGDDIF